MKEQASFIGNDALSKTLLTEGFLMPSENTQPTNSRWLLRSEPFYGVDLESHKLVPKPGEYASWGVFLTDNLQCLPYHPDSSLVYVFDKNLLSKKWLVVNSQSWRSLTNWLCSKQSLNITRIGDCLHAERILYERFPTYNPVNGVYTIPDKIPALRAEKIIVPVKFDQTCLSPSSLLKVCATGI